MGLLSALFGGSSSKGSSQSQSNSQSGNYAYPFLSGALQPPVTAGVNMLGRLNDAIGGSFGDYARNAGLDFQSVLGSQGIVGNAAARGLLNSGSTAKALDKYQTGLNSQFYNNWLDHLASSVGLSSQLASILANAGQYGTSTSTSNSTEKSSSRNGILPVLFGH